MKKLFISLIAACIYLPLTGCSNVLTYIRHDENKGNIQCNGEKGIKRDSSCNVSPSNPTK